MILEGRTAIVTGAGSGIGRAAAEIIAREGATVAVVDRNAEGANETVEAIRAAGGRARALVCDVLGSAPERLRSIEARFSAPGYNGDVLTSEIWLEKEGASRLAFFRVVNQRGDVLLDRGRAEYE